ncbi:hypothetical protein LTR86_010314 [Recurvomyces mirabilis]|nr:hypothetical protein LTR86_010314 [Recurvomyces mirabilis]
MEPSHQRPHRPHRPPGLTLWPSTSYSSFTPSHTSSNPYINTPPAAYEPTSPSPPPRTNSSTSSNSSLDKPPPLDIPRHVSAALYAKGFNVSDLGLVTFRSDSRSHPRNWPLLRKVYDTSLICFLEFFMTLVSIAGSVAADVAGKSLGFTFVGSICSWVTLYMLAQAVGALVFPPIAERFGCRLIYTTSTFIFCLACLLIAVWPTKESVIVGRVVSGLVSAMPAVVASGSLENMWDTRGRIWIIHLWISGAVLGMAVGPAVATYISQSAFGWPFVYGIAGITAFVLSLLCILMQESRPTQVLQQQVRKISKRVQFDQLSADTGTLPCFKEFVRSSLWRPMQLYFTEPIVFVVSFMGAFVYGLIYLFSACLTRVYVDGFGMERGSASLVMLALAVSIPFTFLPRIYDIRLVNRIERSGKIVEPEDKLFGFYVAAPVLAAGLWWFAFSVPHGSSGTAAALWSSMGALILVGYGVIEFDTTLSGYLVDAYGSYAASANAPMSFLRAVLSGIFPLFANQMFEGMGNRNALILLASLATSFCVVAVCFKVYGRGLRQRSRFAEEQQTHEIFVEDKLDEP